MRYSLHLYPYVYATQDNTPTKEHTPSQNNTPDGAFFGSTTGRSTITGATLDNTPPRLQRLYSRGPFYYHPGDEAFVLYFRSQHSSAVLL